MAGRYLTKPAKQPWHCETCGVTGEVEHDPHAGVYEVIYLLNDGHAARSPECAESYRNLRVKAPDATDEDWPW